MHKKRKKNIFNDLENIFEDISMATLGATLTGPTTGVLGVASTFSVSQNTAFTGIVSLSDSGAGGIIDPSQLQWSNSSQTLSFNYIPNQTGTISISATSSIETISGSPISLVVSLPVATSVIFTAPILGNNGDIDLVAGTASSNFTITPNGLMSGQVVPWDGGKGGTFTPSVLTFNNSSTQQTFTYTPVAVNSKVKISLRLPTGFNPVNQYTVAVQPAVATSIVLSWISTAVQAGKQAPLPLVITPNGTYTGTLTLSDGSTGTFWPSNKISIPNASNAPINVYYTPPIASSGGTKSISLSASPSVSITGSPVTITYTASTPFQNFGPGVSNPFYAPNSTNS